MESRLVYSSGQGRMCPVCQRLVSRCACRQKKTAPGGDGIVRVGRETKGRKGKGVTVITGIALDESSLKALAKELKQRCGSGGSVKEGVIEIQGDKRDILMEHLTKRGYTVKRSGG